MKFRSPTTAPIRVALLSGHTALIGPEWRELDPIFHRDALALGAQCDATEIDNPTVTPASSDEAKQAVTDTDTEIRKAIIEMLNRDEDGDFVASTGLPNLTVLQKMLGFRAEKEQVYAVFRAMKDEAGGEAND